MTTQERQQAMAQDPRVPPPKWTSFRELFWGKKVAIVGNAPLDKDYSEEIEACDLVVRVNHAYNLGTKKCGKRTDILVITPTDTWLNLPPRAEGLDIAREYHPKIVSIKFHDRLQWAKMRAVFDGCEFYCIPDRDPSLARFTTGTMLLVMCAEECAECEIKVFGFGTSTGFLEYIQQDGKHYLPNVETEISVREYAFRELAKLSITKTEKEKFHVVIPARKGSSLKDKNIREFEGERLLDRCVKKCIKVFGEGNVSVLTDSEDYAKFAKECGAVVPFVYSEISGRGDVASVVQRWRDITDFVGNVLVVQCTSPNITEETLDKFKTVAEQYIPRGECYISVVEDKHKATSYLIRRLQDGCMVQLFDDLPMSAPRQVLPKMFRFTGAVALFNFRQLRNLPSFFAYSKLHMIELQENEALDIDYEDDLVCNCDKHCDCEECKKVEKVLDS